MFVPIGKLANIISALPAAVGLMVLAQPAHATSAGVNFMGNVTANNACMITLVRPGQFGVSADARQLSSKLAGGVAGIADVIAVRPYEVSVDNPTFFMTAPPGGNTGTTFTTTFSGSSVFLGRTFAEQPGSQKVRLPSGISVTRLNIHLAASNDDAFPSGNYSAITTVRCE